MGENKELLKAQAHIWNHTFKYINSMSLKCIVQLGIPDIIHSHGQPMSLSNLVSALKIQPSKAQCLSCLMRLLVHSGFFSQIQDDDEQEEEGTKYALTPSSRFLLRGVDNTSTLETLPFLFVALHQAMLAPWESMSSWLCSEDEYSTAFEMVNNGKSIWDYMVEEDSDFGYLFSQTMVFDSKLMGRLVTRECKEVFVGLKSMVDVGGRDGTMAMAIVEEFPHINCTVFDLPQVVSNHQQTATNLNFVGGDMFEAKIPPADAVLLKSVLHQWNEEKSIEILNNCKEAICGAEGGGKVIIIEAVLENQIEDKESTETQLCGDVLMMASFTSRKRNETEWKKLFLAAGFSHYKVTSFQGLRSLIQVYP